MKKFSPNSLQKIFMRIPRRHATMNVDTFGSYMNNILSDIDHAAALTGCVIAIRKQEA